MQLSDWRKLVPLSEAELGACDIAVLNLACAGGLPGTDGLDHARSLAVLDSWAGHVARETERSRHHFHCNPRDFHDSWAYFRILVLATVLQEDCGVRYNPDLVQRDDFFANAENLFIHGVLMGKGGTCSSLPPVYVAVGRRLGYPLRLVQTRNHLFARWDDAVSRERFNVECTSRGLNCHPDEYYLTWPMPADPSEAARCDWLTSLGPHEELAVFLANRGHCCHDNGRFRDAVEAFRGACSLAPRNAGHASCLAASFERWQHQAGRERVPLFPGFVSVSGL
jgi:hypothetical protein